jgi:hypothetical protein
MYEIIIVILMAVWRKKEFEGAERNFMIRATVFSVVE